MKRTFLVLAAAFASVVCFVERASAQDSETRAYFREAELAPRSALEITLGTGYAQGFGQLRGGTSNNLNDIANGGMGFNLGVGYRVSPQLGIAAALHYQEFGVGHTREGTTGARGLLAGLDLTYHLDPYRRFAPWVRIGTGYRLLWQTSSGPTALYHGFDFLRLAAGFDFRGSPDVSMGPIVGADLDVFLWERVAGTASTAISDPRVSTYFYVGLQGRFDLGGVRISETMAQTAATP